MPTTTRSSTKSQIRTTGDNIPAAMAGGGGGGAAAAATGAPAPSPPPAPVSAPAPAPQPPAVLAPASSNSSSKRRRLLELEKRTADEIAKIKIQTALHKLKIEKKQIEVEDSVYGSTAHSSYDVADWVDKTLVNIEAPNVNPVPENSATVKFSTPACPRISTQNETLSNSDIKLLAAALRSNHRATQSMKLPTFDGNPAEWLIYKAAYDEDAADLSDLDNLRRLRATLKGEARDTVSALLITNTDPREVIAALKLRFGNTHSIVNQQIEHVKALPKVDKSNIQSMVKFTCTLSNCIATMKTLGRGEHLVSPELYHAVISKLDPMTIDKWYDHADVLNDDSPVLVSLTEFLKKETNRYLAFTPYSSIVPPPSHAPVYSQPLPDPQHAATERVNASTTQGTRSLKCFMCNSDGHSLPDCSEFISKSVDERWQYIKDNKICVRCLVYSNHIGRYCRKSKYLHNLLKREITISQSKESNLDSKMPPSNQSEQLNNCIDNNSLTHKTFLKVLPVTVSGSLRSVNTFALLDEGATITLINSKLANEIGTDGPSIPLHLQGLGSNILENCKNVNFEIKGKNSKAFNIKGWTKNDLELGLQSVNKTELLQFAQIKRVEHLIDWYEHGIPKIIIGQDNWPLIITQQVAAGKTTEPVGSKTSLGWVLHGCISSTKNIMKVNYNNNQVIYKVSNEINEPYRVTEENFSKNMESDQEEYSVSRKIIKKNLDYDQKEELYRVTTINENDDDLYTLVKQSFELDSLGIQPRVRCNPIEERAINILQSTTKKLDETTWETGLLWQNEKINLPNHSKNMAIKRFESLERNLKKNPNLSLKYTEEMQKLFKNQYAVYCQPQSDINNDSWFLPHFAVVNPNKPGKVRPVFDAAAKIQGVSLNDKLLSGPDLLESLLGLLWRFRLKRIGASADIRDMFLRIKIKEKDQDYQKFLWREPSDPDPPKICKMTSMLFGATCSPCSAIYVKNNNAKQFQDKYPESVESIIKNHYVDDYLESYDTESEGIQRITEIILIHAQGGFDIRSWASNSENVLKAIPEEKRAHENIDLTPEAGQKNKTLGMVWEPSTDTLTFNLSMNRVPSKIALCQERPTKRQMLSVIMSVFDPLGLVIPLTVKGRILLQEVWRSKIDWDDKIEDKHFEKWRKWIQELNIVKTCKIPRCYSQRLGPQYIDLHTFCDASEKAYAAACYLRYQYEDGEVKVVLVAAKAKVTPLRPMSIPRLELQAALLGARLAKIVDEEHGIKIHEKYYWSDSGTTIAWIRSDPRKYKPYVGHRLAAIDDLTSISQWKWVPTADNVADIATRDIASCHFSPEDRWFSGPNFLYQPETEWPREKENLKPTPETITEEKVNVVTVKSNIIVPDFTRFSSLQRLIRATAYMLLFIRKCRKTGAREINVDILNEAEKMLVKKAQFDSYSKEISQINRKETIKESVILHVTPYIDNDGVLRARGRIDMTPDVSDTCKRPIILDHSHVFTKLLISEYHKQQHHASTETVLNEIRQKYYITKLRSTLRLISYHCQVCKIRRATPCTPIMGDLPYCRLDHHKRPFTHCGLDYFGPIEVTIGRRREKRYGALFTCMVTRGVHLELAGSLTTDSAIMAIRRMIGRRGCPTDIYSDNGTNFKGADTELKKAWNVLVKDENFQQELVTKRIKWHFIPASAANMGGAWERMVQSVKKALYATLHERAPREETLMTLLVEAEYTVNSRPLVQVSDDVNDQEALTPNHFLLGSSSGVSSPGKFDDKDLMLRKQWKIAQRLADMFWQRWLKEYLPTLLPRTGKDSEDDLKVGDLVVIADGTLPRNMWPKGIVKATFPGKDNRTRVVDVKSTAGTFRRPSNKVLRLPVESTNNPV